MKTMRLGKRILALALCILLFVSLLPARANAAGAYTDEDGIFHFFSYEQLKKEITRLKNAEASLTALYEGSGALTIKESVTLPAGFDLTLDVPEVIIEKGATVTLAKDSYATTAKLTVKGKLICREGSTLFVSALNVSGSLENHGSVLCDSLKVSGSVQNSDNIDCTTLSGRERIQHKGDGWTCINRFVDSVAQMESALAEAANDPDLSFSYWIVLTKSLTLSKSLTIPANAQLLIGWHEAPAVTLTLAKGATLTNLGYCSVEQPNARLSIRGAFVNHGVLWVSAGGVASLDGGSYQESENAYIDVGLPYDEDSGTYKGNPDSFLPGFNLKNFSRTQDENWYTYRLKSKMNLNGWQKLGDSWYFFEDGALLTDAWAKDSKGWCYLGADGRMVTNTWKKDSKGWCYLKADGRMAISQWVKDGGKWYYLDAKGYMLTGWQKISGNWYYLNSSGAMLTGWQKIGGTWYHFKSGGAMTANAWAKDSKGWCYLGSDGKMVTNVWKKDSQGWCYLGANGRMTVSQWVKDGGKWYYLDGSGYMKTGWLKLSGNWYYLESSGAMVTGSRTIGGKTYTFNSSGVCQNP